MDKTDSWERRAQGWRRLRAIKGSRCERLRGWERERGAGKKLPSACDQPAASEMRTEGTSRLHLLACSPACCCPPADPKKKSPCNLVPALEFSLMSYVLYLCLMSYTYVLMYLWLILCLMSYILYILCTFLSCLVVWCWLVIEFSLKTYLLCLWLILCLMSYILYILCTFLSCLVVWCWLVILLHWLAGPPRLKAD